MLAAEIRKRPVKCIHSSRWRWRLDEMFVKINGERGFFADRPPKIGVDPEAENRRLKRELARVTEERDTLKKQPRT